MAAVEYTAFVRNIFCTGELDKEVQAQIVRGLTPVDHEVPAALPALLSITLLKQALRGGYNVVTRFIPPYCSTVTFYDPKIGFVAVSRLCSAFDTTIVNIPGEPYWVTQAAFDTIEGAYNSQPEVSRSENSHNAALNPPPAGIWDSHTVYLRKEGPPCDPLVRVQFSYTSATRAVIRAQFSKNIQPKQQHFWGHGVAKLCNRIFLNSNVDFGKGPASVMNDFLYGTHHERFAKNVHIINGELSGHLYGWTGKSAAFLNLSWTSAIIAAILALATTTTISATTGKIIASSVLGGLLLFQFLWTYLVSSTNFENIASNDIRLRHIRQASTLFGLDMKNLKLLLAMVSPWKPITAHGQYNSYIEIADTGVLEVTDPEPMALIYLAGYITTSLELVTAQGDTETLPLAVWVPYDTHRVVYGCNDRIRRFSKIDNLYHLSGSQRSRIVRQDGELVLKHDSDTFWLPTDLKIYSEFGAAVG